MESTGHMMKVISPVEGKNGKTFWMRLGTAFRNRDGSLNVYLNAYPTNGKLQLRELDERDTAPRSGAEPAFSRGGMDRPQDQLPF